MITLNQKVLNTKQVNPNFALFLTAEERQKVKQKIQKNISLSPKNTLIKLDLARGSFLEAGDILTNQEQDIFVEIKAESEPVITVKAESPLKLLKAAYHLGNRHVSLEIGEHYLRFSPDHVLEAMLTKMGLKITAEVVPFYPEIGAYKHH